MARWWRWPAVLAVTVAAMARWWRCRWPVDGGGPLMIARRRSRWRSLDGGGGDQLLLLMTNGLKQIIGARQRWT
jgi:hypothetical protein